MVEQSSSGWKRFWEHGGFWRALLLAAVYYGLYELFGYLLGFVTGAPDLEPGTAEYVLLATALPIVFASIALVVFAMSLGWLKEIFGRQSIGGRGWMWIGIGVVLAINVSALLSIDYGKAGFVLVATWLLTGLFIGFAEEVLTRGFVVNLMRKAGHGEIAVALASAGLFAALHIGNVFTSTQGLAVTLLQVVYTFAFGICMYLALRVTRTIWAPILIHASTDPTLFLQGGYPAGGVFGLLPALSTYLVIALGFVLLIVLIVSERRRSSREKADAVG